MQKNKDSKGRNLNTNESQMPDGRYRYRYTDKLGNRRAIYSWKLVLTDKLPKGKKECTPLRELESKILKDKNDNIDTYYANTLTLNDLFDKYMKLNITLRPSTKSNYISMWNKNIKNQIISNIPIINIKKSDIGELYSNFKDIKKFSITTIQLYQNILFPTFQMAVNDEIIRTNPCLDAMKKLKQGALESNRLPLTREEQKILQTFLKEDTFYRGYYPCVMFFLSTGARMGEMLGLTWEDIDFENNLVILKKQALYRRIDGKVQWVIGKLKWARNKVQSTRVIPLSEDIIEILKEYKDSCYFYSINSDFEISTVEEDINEIELLPSYKHFVFINSEGKLPTPASINRTLLGITTRYNKLRDNNSLVLPEFSAHVLRHTFATRNAENGMDIKVLQSLMGHKNIGVTMDIYNHVSNERAISEVVRVSSPLL